MRTLFAFVAVLALAAAHHGGAHQKTFPDLFEGQREYVYNYRSLVATGLPRQSQQYAGLEKYATLTVQVQQQQGNTKFLGLRLGRVTSGSFDKEVEDIENRHIEGVAHSTEEHIEKYGPVFVKIQDNQVEELKAPEGMPEEIINIYRGIAALFTVAKPEIGQGEEQPFMKQGLNGEPVVYRRIEEGITGNCETTYEILSNPLQHHHHLNVTKTRNYMKCLGRDPRFLQNGHDARGCKNVCPNHKPEQLEASMKPEMSNWQTPVAEGCPVDFHPKKELVEAFTTYNYNMTVQGGNAIIRQAQALDKKILPLRKQQINTVSLIKINLLEERQIQQAWEQTRATKKYEDITYRFPEGHKFDLEYLSLYNKAHNVEMLKEQIIPMIKALAKVIVSDNIELKGQTGDKIVQLTMALGALKKPELQALWKGVGHREAGQPRTDIEHVQRKVLLDTIALSGSNDAAELLLELIQQDKTLNTLETVHILEALQKNLAKPTTQILNQILGVCTNENFKGKRTIFSTACITLGELVRGHCGKHHTGRYMAQEQQQNFCSEQEYKQYVLAVREKLYKSVEYPEQAVYIQTLARFSHPVAIKALIPFVYGQPEVIAMIQKVNRHDERENVSEYIQFIRQVAIYALHHSVREHGAAIQPIMQGIYFNQEENYELRIAALSVLLASQPTEAMFGRIVMELPQEQDMEVASYTYSALRSLANATLPCMQQTARRVQNVIGGLPNEIFGAHRSKWVAFTRYMNLANLGLKGQWDVAQSNVSAIPRAIYGGLTSNKGPFVSTVFDFGMISKGFENLDKYLHGKGGMDKIAEHIMQRVRRNARTFTGEESVQKMLDEIEQTIQFNNDENREEPRAVVYGSFLGNELYLPVDKEYMTKVAKNAGEQIFKILREKGVEKTFRFVRILLPRTFVQVTPGVNGLPVVLTNRHPIVVSVTLKDLKTRFGAEQGKLHPFTFALSGLIQPTVYHTSIHSAFVIDTVPETRVAYGLRTVEQTYLTLPVDASVQYTHLTRTLGFTIRPRFEKVFFHKTRAMTFKTEALLIREPNTPLLERYTVLKTQEKPFEYERVFGQKLGMALRVQGMSMNEEYAINFLRNRLSREKNPIEALLKEITNEWFVPRQWAVRVERNQDKPVEEVQMFLRFGSLLSERMQEEQKQQQSPRVLSQEQIRKEEQEHPEDMRMVGYEHEFEKLTHRKPETEKLEKALERIVKKTEKYWTQVDSEQQLRQQLNKEGAQLRSVEYVIAAKGQRDPVAITGHVYLGSTYNKQAKLAEIKMNVEKRPISFETQAIAAFTKPPQPFESEVREQEQRGIAAFVAELETRQTGKQQYAGKVEMKKSEEQMRLTKEQKPWWYHQCEQDKKEQKAEISDACEQTRYHKSILNHLHFEVQIPQKNHELLKNVTHKIRESLKVLLYRNLRANYVAKTVENQIEGEIIYSEQAPEVRMADVIIRTPDHEELRFERIAFPKALRPNTMWSIKEQAKALLKDARPEPTCVYNGKNLRTFDNVTISLQAMKDGHKYVVARDNDEEPKFTVIVKKQGEKHEVEILLRNTTLLRLTPPTQSSYKVRMNSTEVEISPKNSEVQQYASKSRHMLTLHVEEHKEGQDTLVVKVRDQRMRIVYDGKNLKIVIAKRTSKGQLTGLCGDMNNQHVEELTGPQGCNYEQEQDFVRAFGLSKEHEPIEGKWHCPEGIYPRGAKQHQIDEHKQRKMQARQHHQQMFNQRQTHRHQDDEEMDKMTEETKMFVHQDQVCFSVEPAKVCKHGYRQAESKTQRLPFVCVSKHSQHAVAIQREIQTYKVASSLPSVSRGLLYKDIQVPKKCHQ